MTFQQELASWWSPGPATTALGPAPRIGDPAPRTSPFSPEPGRPTVITFLRHCGCPWAEKTFLNLRAAAQAHRDVAFVAVSHSDAAATQTWLAALPQAGSEPANLRTVVDEPRAVYAAWGLGPASWAHVLSPWSLYEAYRLGRREGIWNRPTESGSRWQTSGSFAADAEGVVRWGGPAGRADDVPDFEEAVAAVEASGKVGGK